MKLMHRPYKDDCEMFKDIKTKHNAIVKPSDRVLFLGDAVSRTAADKIYWLNQIEQLNGIKTIACGNHDRIFTEAELKTVFDVVIPEGGGVEFDVQDEKQVTGGPIIQCYGNHYPIQGRVDRFNLCGHVHEAWRYQKNMLNMSVDVHNFTPMAVSEVVFYLKAITDFFDDDCWCYNSPINNTHESRGKKGNRLDEFRAVKI